MTSTSCLCKWRTLHLPLPSEPIHHLPKLSATEVLIIIKSENILSIVMPRSISFLAVHSGAKLDLKVGLKNLLIPKENTIQD